MIFAVSKILRNFAIRNNQRQKIWQATLAELQVLDNQISGIWRLLTAKSLGKI